MSCVSDSLRWFFLAGRWFFLTGLTLLTACTSYEPVSWSEGRRVAPVRTALPTSGVDRYVVMPGDTLSELALRFRLPMAELARRNGLRPPYRIYVGQVLRIGSGKRRVVDGVPPRRTVTAPAEELALARTRKAAQTEPPPLSGKGFLWPVQGKLIDTFGAKPDGRRNDGINIAAGAGTPVRAVENGIVVYAGSAVPAFGRMLIIRHAGGYLSTYAHNDALLVTVGDRVRRGQVIARVGATGSVSRPQLHFQLRAGRDPVDPRKFLGRETELARSG